MSKLSYEDKINIYQERKSGISVTNIAKKYNINVHNIKYISK